jgi:hypothetical protein
MPRWFSGFVLILGFGGFGFVVWVGECVAGLAGYFAGEEIRSVFAEEEEDGGEALAEVEGGGKDAD